MSGPAAVKTVENLEALLPGLYHPSMGNMLICLGNKFDPHEKCRIFYTQLKDVMRLIHGERPTGLCQFKKLWERCVLACVSALV